MLGARLWGTEGEFGGSLRRGGPVYWRRPAHSGCSGTQGGGPATADAAEGPVTCATPAQEHLSHNAPLLRDLAHVFNRSLPAASRHLLPCVPPSRTLP